MPHLTARTLLAALALATSAGGGPLAAQAPAPATPAWLTARATQQRELSAQSSARHDFTFADHLANSGITFTHRIVDDAGRDYKAVHYDHGTGMCAADVDRDGRSDLFFTTQLGENELWRNLGGGRFANITESAGVRMTNPIAVGCAFGDVDNDGLPDLFLTTVRHGNRLFRNTGGGKFRDITATAGVGHVGHSSGAVFFDYDRDGLLDLLVTNVGKYTTDAKGPGGYYVGHADAFHSHIKPERADTNILYRNLGGARFADVTKETGLVDAEYSGDAVIVDVNADGFPDVYSLSMQGFNTLWINEGGKRFRNGTATYFPKTPWGAMGAKVFDFNGDAKLDLFVTDMHSDMFNTIAAGDWAGEARKSDTSRVPAMLAPVKDRSIWGNALFTAPATGQAWLEVSDSLGVESFWPWGTSVDDVNADGWDDIFITASMNFPFRYAVNSLLLNEGGRRFLPSEFTLGVEPRAPGAMEQPWFTVSCEPGSPDADGRGCGMCKEPRPADSMCRAGTDGKLTIWSARGSRSSLFLDIDDDGDLDLVTSEFNGQPQVLISDLAARGRVNFLKLRLRGTRSNRAGIGAQVTVVLPDGRRILKMMDGKSGYLGQSDLPLYFGLAGFDRATSIEVLWPNGARQTVAGPIVSGRTLEITER